MGIEKQKNIYGYEDYLAEHITQDGKKLYSLGSTVPVGDGFYNNPGFRYMGIMNRSTRRLCETCSNAGLTLMCQSCSRRWW